MSEVQDAIIEKLSKLENVIAEFDDVIKDEAADYSKECGIISKDVMEKHLNDLVEENRLLNIGIIGRVKAGKSSLLNSIFFKGESILPKAATPMTASLTVITYGDTCSATVEYFSPQDIATITKEHGEYRAAWDVLFEKKKKEVEERAKKRGESPDMEKAKRQTDAEMKETRYNASYDQYERMQGISAPNGTTEVLNASSMIELLGKLNDYVGSNGKKMPYTKSVELRIPEDSLRDICVVDTPGINDPVKSREARTEDYMKKCDVVFIISPAGQFISSEDTALMDRISTKEGVRELFLVASQADTQLYGSVGDETSFRLNETVEKLREYLSSHAISVLSNLKTNSPEVADQFDKLIQDGKERIMITSAICNDMLLKYNDRSSWESGMIQVWEVLDKYYSDYFNSDESAKTNLKLLSGIAKVKEKIGIVRQEKDKIISDKQVDYINSQSKTVADFLTKLISEVKGKSDKIKNTDIAQVEKQKKQTEVLVSKGTQAIDGTFEDSVDEFKIKVRNAVSRESRAIFEEAKNQNTNAEQSRTETRHWTTGWWLWKKYHSENYEVRTLRTGVVKSTLNNLVADLQDTLINTIENEKMEWKQSVQTKVTRALREAVNDDDLIDIAMLKTALRRLVNNMELPNLDLGSNTFSTSLSGTIEDGDIDLFMDEVQAYTARLRNTFDKARDEFISIMEKSAKREKMSGMLFSDLQKQLDILGSEIQNKELTLDRLKKCGLALEKIV